MGRFEIVCDGITQQVRKWIGNLLNDVVIEFGVAARQIEFNYFVGRMRGIADGTRKARVERADGHHSGRGDFVLQVVREFRELVNIALASADEATRLSKHFVTVRGNFRPGPCQNVYAALAT